MAKHPKDSKRKSSLSSYIVCFHLLPKEDDEKHEDVYGGNLDRIVDAPIEIALSDMNGVHVFGNVWIVQAPRTNSRKLRDSLNECVDPDDLLIVSRIKLKHTHGNGIGGALDLL